MQLLDRVNTGALDELDTLSVQFGEDIAYDIVDVIGVLIGLKPVAMIGGNSEVPNIDDDLIGMLGLRYDAWAEKNLTYVSRSQEQAARLAELHKIVWGMNAAHPDKNREIGALLGYPETATDYFLKRLESLETDSPLPIFEPDELAGSVSRYFCELILSPDHYKDELKAYSLPLEKGVQEFAPKTYDMFCALSSRS